MKMGKTQALELVDGFPHVTPQEKERAKRLLEWNIDPEAIMRLLGEINAATNLLHIYEADTLRRNGAAETPAPLAPQD